MGFLGGVLALVGLVTMLTMILVWAFLWHWSAGYFVLGLYCVVAGVLIQNAADDQRPRYRLPTRSDEQQVVEEIDNLFTTQEK